MTVSAVQQNTVQLVKDAAQIVDIIAEHVALKRAGANLKGCCPFHAEKTPSFIVSPERQSFHCFGCGEGGDVFTFMMKYHRLTFPETLKELARRYHIELPASGFQARDQARAEKRQTLFAINQLAAKYYHEYLLQDPAADPARAYLAQRGIPPETIERYKLGYAPDRWDFFINQCRRANIALEDADEAGLVVKRDRGGYYDRFRDRVLFPIYELTGKVVGFGGRILGPGEPKYLNSPETPIFNKSRTLFGLYQNRESIRRLKRAVIVEGNFDLLSLAVHGIDNGVAPLGTALTPAQVRTVKGYVDEVILLFDGDEAGLKAAMRTVPIFLAEQVQARVVTLPAGHDPDTFIREYGRPALEKHLADALPLPEFVFEQLVEKHGLTMEGKGRILKELQPLVESVADDPLQRSVLISRFCDRLALDVHQVEEGFRAAGRPEPSRRPAVPITEVTLPQKQKHLLEFLIIHPEFLEKFLDAGIEEVLDAPLAGKILAALKKIEPTVGRPVPEMLLDILPDGVERSFVTRLLIAAQTYGAEQDDVLLAEVAAEQLAWLHGQRLSKEIDTINREIEAATEAKDDRLLLELSSKKSELNRALKASLTGGEE
jgi:DNA primase